MQADQQIDQLTAEFQQAWKSGSPLPVADFVRQAPKQLRSKLALKIIQLDIRNRIANSQDVSAEDYAMFGAGGIKLAERVIEAVSPKSAAVNAEATIIAVDQPSQGLQETVIASGGSTLDGDESVVGQPARDDVSLRSSPRRGTKTFGRFELKSVLGSGSFGEVHKAWDPHLERFVALKIPLFDSSAKKQIARFLSEAKSMARLKHQNIVATLESGTIEDQLYIASELIEGQRLSERLDRRKLPPKRAVKIAAKLADAIDYAHQNNVIHRDIKPENIILDSDGEPHIMDFGLAKRTDDDEHMTTEGALLGTPAYMSPEQARGENDLIGPQSDQYSLAVVLYHMLCGQPPFDGPAHSVVLKVAKGDVPSVRSVYKHIDRKLEAIVLKALSVQPEDRYASCAEFCADLIAWERGTVVKARPASNTGRMLGSVRKFGPMIGLSTLLCVLACFVAYAGWWLFFGDDASTIAAVTDQNAKDAPSTLPTPGGKPLAQQISLADVQLNSDGSVSMFGQHVVYVPYQEEMTGTRSVERTVFETREEPYSVLVNGQQEQRTRTVTVPRTVTEQVPYTYTVTKARAEERQSALPNDTLVMSVEDNELRPLNREQIFGTGGRPCISVSTREDAERARQSLAQLFGDAERYLYVIRDETYRYSLPEASQGEVLPPTAQELVPSGPSIAPPDRPAPAVDAPAPPPADRPAPPSRSPSSPEDTPAPPLNTPAPPADAPAPPSNAPAPPSS